MPQRRPPGRHYWRIPTPRSHHRGDEKKQPQEAALEHHRVFEKIMKVTPPDLVGLGITHRFDKVLGSWLCTGALGGACLLSGRPTDRYGSEGS